MLGGSEKLTGALTLGDLPLLSDPDRYRALRQAIATYDPSVVVDLSDAPVVDLRSRSILASTALSLGVAYHGADFRFDVPDRPRRARTPSIAVIGTGKRTGKTAISAALARHAVAMGRTPVIVAMGRGGPAEPIVVRGDRERPTPEWLLAIADRGEHAASDVYEDAVVAGVMAVGARRAGAGLAGAPFSHTVHEAVDVADALGGDLLILEGSGTAIPPVAADATLLVAGGGTHWTEVAMGLGPYRRLIADGVVVTMAEEPVLAAETLSVLTSPIPGQARSAPLVTTVFRPNPITPVESRTVFVATTAPIAVGDRLRHHLEQVHGATVVGISHALSDRPTLAKDLDLAEGTYDVLLTEVKAAAIDVAVRAAKRAGARVVFYDNVPVSLDGDLATLFDALLNKAGP